MIPGRNLLCNNIIQATTTNITSNYAITSGAALGTSRDINYVLYVRQTIFKIVILPVLPGLLVGASRFAVKF